MDASDINRLLTTDHYSPADLEVVGDLCRNFPAFNLAHMLKVRIQESLGQEKGPDLKVAAVYAVDRRKLYQMVTEAAKPEVPEEDTLDDEPEGIRFSDEPHQEADVIIEQHAPYAGPEKKGDLLELEEEEDSFTLDPDEEKNELSSETLIEAVAKDEVEMEDPDTEETETPVIDMVEPESEHEPESADQEPQTKTDSEPIADAEAQSDAEPESTADPEPETESEPVKRSNDRLILNFLNEDPGPIRAEKRSGIREDVSLASVREHDGFITDTLARIYVKQGLYAKAIYAYEKLSLKYPEKSAYFAAQIEKIRNINRS